MLRPPFQGSRRKLVLAFDIGTTFSGISYSVLDPGQIPEIKSVTRFPSHQHIAGASKIPTIIYYDQKGNVRAVGAEAVKEGIFEKAEDENWVKAEWFKLHLRSKIGHGKDVNNDQIPVLPLNYTVVEVLADFLKYLLECASTYIQATHANGPELWNSVKEEIHFVLSHPNGWEGAQQAEMRKAAVLAKLTPNTKAGRARLTFVTEGEASLHFAIQNGLPSAALEDGAAVVIVDAGGGTIDVSSYRKNNNVFEEVALPQSYFHGSVFVNINAYIFLSSLLEDSTFADDVEHIVGCFDKTTKLRFSTAEEPEYIKFGSTRDNDERNNIRFGQLKIQGSDVAMFFKPSIDCIVQAVKKQKRLSQKTVSYVVLVGGFSASDWLFHRVMEEFSVSRLTIIRPEIHLNKAVADGAMSFYLDHCVHTRVSRHTYGTICARLYDPMDPDHVQRLSTSYKSVSGEILIPNGFSVILLKNTQVLETQEFGRSYCWEETNIPSDSFSVWGYSGMPVVADPKWINVDPEHFTKLCKFKIYLSHVPSTCITKQPEGPIYFCIDYEIILFFGLTEMQAQMAWKDGSVERRSLAVTIN